jgi:hypothetical protein
MTGLNPVKTLLKSLRRKSARAPQTAAVPSLREDWGCNIRLDVGFRVCRCGMREEKAHNMRIPSFDFIALKIPHQVPHLHA